jgi:aspartate/methionine/tyrosine aminotransferase
MCDIAGEYDVPIVTDEIYDMCTFDGVKAVSVAKLANDVPVIVTNGMAKSFMTTGWRVGYLAFHDPKGKIAQVKSSAKVLKALTGNIATPISVAALTAYQNWDKGMEHFRTMKESLQKSKDLTVKRFKEIPGISTAEPKGAMYAFPKVEWVGKVWTDDHEFMLQLLTEQQVVFVPGSNYGPTSGFGHFRALLLPPPADLEVIYDRLEKFMNDHKPA